MRALDFLIKLCRVHSQTNKVLSSNLIYVHEIHHMIKKSLKIAEGKKTNKQRSTKNITQRTKDQTTR